jgi:geranylgeranyl reductase family protein
MSADLWDVAVVGAGPAGSTAAALFAQRGYHVVLLDRAHFPRAKACAEYMSPGVREVMRRLGLEGALARACPVPGMEIVSPRGARLRVQYETDGRRRYAATLPRQALDLLLLEHAAAAGAHVIEGVVARMPLVEDGAVRGVFGRLQHRDLPVRARLTVVADGSRSVLARALNLSTAPRWPVRLGLVAHYAGPAPLRDGFGEMHVAHSGYCGVAPLPDGLLNVALVVRADALRTSPYAATQFMEQWIASQARLRRLLEGCERVTPVRGVGPIGSRTSRVQAPGALLVGDAAGFFDPFTGEGIYRALRSAELAAQFGSAALAQADISRGESLAGYDAAWRQTFRWKEAVTALVQLFVQYPRLMDYALPRLRERNVPSHTLSAVLGDLADARQFLTPGMLWAALQP